MPDSIPGRGTNVMFRSNIFHFLPYETRGGRGGGILLSNRQLLRTQAGISSSGMGVKRVSTPSAIYCTTLHLIHGHSGGVTHAKTMLSAV